MKNSGAYLTVYALEQIGVRKTFGIPGIHNTEIYSQLSNSRFIEPIVVTHELSAGFMADAVSRTTDSIGTMVIVPGSGMTHGMSAIGQAFVDGIPLMIISGGINRKAGKSFQMHQLNMEKVLDGIVKAYYRISSPAEIVATIYEAYEVAINCEPGPVFIEIPIEMQLTQAGSESIVPYIKKEKENPFGKEILSEDSLSPLTTTESINDKLNSAVSLLMNANKPGIYVGWGAVDCQEEIMRLAELLVAPVSTTLQGLSAFPYNHPLHAGIGFGPVAVPSAENAFADCDCLLAVGLKFSELATGNYQMDVPENLIHIDINPEVFHRNYHAKVAIEGDSKIVLKEILDSIEERSVTDRNTAEKLIAEIKKDKEAYKNSWVSNPSEQMVTPGFFYNALYNNLPEESILVTDDGNHMLLTAELFPVTKARQFICPTDYSGMGYGIPAAVGAKLLNRHKQVVAIVGDGALQMCGFELITSHIYKLGLLVFVFRDHESKQITQKQKNTNPMAKDVAFGALDLEGFASSVQAGYLAMKTDIDISGVFTKAMEQIKTGKTMVIEVNIDYSRKSKYSSNLLKPKSSRIRFTDRMRMLIKGSSR